MKGRRGRRRRKLLNDLKESRVYSNLKEGTLDRTMWRARFGKKLWTCRKAGYQMMNVNFVCKKVKFFTNGHVEINAGLQCSALRTTIDVVLLSLLTKRSNRCSFNYARTLLFAIVFHYEAN